MPNPFLVPVYLIYTAVSIGLVFWLARTLFRNGAIFLEDVFEDNEPMAQAVNRLLVIGFYMLNLGYAALLLKSESAPDAISAVEVLAQKLGVLLLSLAVLHFVNMYVFYRIRRRATAAVLPPPVAHHGMVQPTWSPTLPAPPLPAPPWPVAP